MARKSRKVAPPMYESYIFEITRFEPTYRLSVEHRKYHDGPYWEHADIAFDASCLFPAKVAGRTASFNLVAARDFWTPDPWQRDHDWRPLCVGMLELSPNYGRFYSQIPFDSMPGFVTAMAHGLYRYVLLSGPPLKRGKSPCSGVRFSRVIDLDDY